MNINYKEFSSKIYKFSLGFISVLHIAQDHPHNFALQTAFTPALSKYIWSPYFVPVPALDTGHRVVKADRIPAFMSSCSMGRDYKYTNIHSMKNYMVSGYTGTGRFELFWDVREGFPWKVLFQQDLNQNRC